MTVAQCHDSDSIIQPIHSNPVPPTDRGDCAASVVVVAVVVNVDAEDAATAADDVSVADQGASVIAAVHPILVVGVGADVVVIAAVDDDCLHGTFDSIDSSMGAIATVTVDAVSENGAAKNDPRYRHSADVLGIADVADVKRAAELGPRYPKDLV